MSKFSETRSLDNYKEKYRKIKDYLPEKVRIKIDRTIKNLELIQRRPKTDYHVIGSQRTYAAVHPNETPYTKEELSELNLLESIPEVILGKPKFPTCQYCGEKLGKKQTKFCSDTCQKYNSKLRKKMKDVYAVGIFITHDKKKPPGVKPYWRDLKAVYETRFEDEKTFVTEPLPAAKGKYYKKGKHRKEISKQKQ